MDEKFTQEFETIYVTHHSRMLRFAQEYVNSKEDAENIVHDIFLELWDNKSNLLVHTNIFSFLFTSVKNRCIDFLRHKTTVEKSKSQILYETNNLFKFNLESLEAIDDKVFSEQNIEEIIQDAINSLPEKCREIFILNKIQGKKQKEIAKLLDISINTVEAQMAIAYKKLRELLKNNFPILFFFFI